MEIPVSQQCTRTGHVQSLVKLSFPHSIDACCVNVTPTSPNALSFSSMIGSLPVCVNMHLYILPEA